MSNRKDDAAEPSNEKTPEERTEALLDGEVEITEGVASADDLGFVEAEEDELPKGALDADDDSDGGDAEPEVDIEVSSSDIPFELQVESPNVETKTGLVSEFHDLSGRQTAWLVSNRETATLSRSPLFYVTALVIGLGVLAALVIGIGNARAEMTETPVLATVGFGDQAAQIGQQLGVEVKDVESVEEAEKLVRQGGADAAFIQDTTGQSQGQLIALNSEPTELQDALSPKMEVTYLEPPAVSAPVSQAAGWGMAALLIASIMTLGGGLYANARIEKRNHITEILAAAVSPRSSAWGRVWGLTILSLGYLAIAGGILLLGLSVGGQTTLAFDMLPGLGWFAGLFLLAHILYLSLYLWVTNAVKKRGRQIGLGIVLVLLIGGAVAPLLFLQDFVVLKVLSYIPFTAPVAMPMRYFAGQAEWWEGVLALAIMLVVGLVAFALASKSYERNVLKGAGRGGKKAVAKADKKAAKKEKAAVASSGAATGSSSDADDAEAAASSDDDAESSDSSEEKDADVEGAGDASDSAKSEKK